MRISKIELTNFRNHEDLVLPFDQRRTLLIGENGSGKSGVPDAIAWALTGICRGVDAKGAGQRKLIRHGETRAEVTIHLDGIGPVTRSITAGGSAVTTVKTEALLGQLGTTAGMLHAVLYSRAFFDLHHAEAKALLMAALNVRVKATDLPGIDLGTRTDVDLGMLDALYEQHYQARADVKRKLGLLTVPEKPKVIDIALAKMTLADLRTSLREHQDTLNTLTTTAARAIATHEHTKQDIATGTQKQGSIDQLKGKKQAHDGMLAKAHSEKAIADRALTDANALPAEPIETLTADIQATKVLIDKLGSHDPDRGCVLAASIPCLTKGTQFAGHISSLQVALDGMADRVRAGQERDRQITAARAQAATADRDVRYHEGQIEAAARDLADAEDAARELKRLKADLPKQKRAAEEAVKARDAHVEVVQGLLAKVTTLAEYEQAKVAHQQAIDKRADLEADVDREEKAVALLGPKGARMAALNAALDTFTGAMNQALQPFGFVIRITVDPWLVEIGRGEHWTAFDMMSKGESLWIGLAFQLALAKVAGMDFCVLDDVEAVVGKNRQRLTGTVMTSGLGQVIISMAKAGNEPAPTLDGLQVVRFGEAA
jgi:hypothetical protein